ncbi:MAG TPA: glutathione S-transferase N-terminal domain-containing protein [Gammaproteobacteria bacterium]|nr:glutathione S-transferase N-terminal domain-containing protein [Gammaproteobacteria bacterium]
MAVVSNRRSVMTLFSQATCPDSHRIRLVLAEKGITYETVEADPDNPPEDLLDLNPYSSVPTLVDRELVLYDGRVIMEYLDERFPHPPLMPVDPVSRARFRLILYRLERDWYSLVGDLARRSDRQASKARKLLRERILSGAEVFAARPYFMSDDFSLVDASIAPVLWRLPHWGIELPGQARAIEDYARRMFERDSFRASLTDAELEMRA